MVCVAHLEGEVRKCAYRKTSIEAPDLSVQFALTPGLYPGPGLYAAPGFHRYMCLSNSLTYLLTYNNISIQCNQLISETVDNSNQQ